ncbi:hypothetical protein G6F38_003947 [Rhizopus arrhizus]|nr:hypothetical protein G6F38_003947 [Rhizopus arrhizus]
MPPDSINPINITALINILSAEENSGINLQIRILPQSIGLPQMFETGVFSAAMTVLRLIPPHNQHFDVPTVEPSQKTPSHPLDDVKTLPMLNDQSSSDFPKLITASTPWRNPNQVRRLEEDLLQE